MSRIFLSHSSKDNFEAVALKGWLAAQGWSDVFLDLDPERGIAAGERWERALHAAANRCEAVIFLVSESWLASGWCVREYQLARGLNKKLFAALIDPERTIESLPAELTGVWQIANLIGAQDHKLFPTQLPGSHEERHIAYSQAGLARLKRGLEKAGLDPRFFDWPPEGERGRAPYRGLKPQEAEDAGIFFGRDAPIVEAIDRLRGLRAGAPPRLFAILGASGAGKSSFLRAGLLPRLKRDDAQFIAFPVIRPERAALTGETGFVNALASVLTNRSRAEARTATLAGAAALRPMLAEVVMAALAGRVAGDETERPPAFVIAIDQAEELFRAEGREESSAFLTLLTDLAAGDDPTVIVIFCIRSDSYDALQSAKPLEGMRQVAFSLAPMPRGAYQEVIGGPARRVEEAGGKLTIEPALTQKLLGDIEAGAGDALPLLAFTLEQLYLDYRQTGALRLADYEAFGGLTGAINAAVERAFARADSDPRTPRDREARLASLRRGLIPWLAGVDPDSKTPRRNIARRADIPADALPLIDLLAEERLLSRDTRMNRDSATTQETHEATIEPAHESLLRLWRLLDGWLKEDFALLTTLEGAKRAARDWEANAQGQSWLAHQGERLVDAQALDARPDIAARLDATDRAYLAACAKREEAARAEAEERRRERDAEQARKLADARTIARRTRIGAAAALVLALAAGGFGLYALSQRAAAERSAQQAEAQRVAAEAAKSEAQTQRDGATRSAQEAKDQRDAAEAARKDALEQKALADQRAKEATEQRQAAVRNQSVALTALGEFEAQRHNPINAAKLALAAWPRDANDPAPKLDATLDLLGQVVPQLRERVRIPSGGTIASFSPDGTRLVTAPGDGTTRIWDVADGHLTQTLPANSVVVFAAFRPDGNSLVTASKDGAVRFWDLRSGKEIGQRFTHAAEITAADVSRDGNSIVAGYADGSATIWNAATGAVFSTFEDTPHEDTPHKDTPLDLLGVVSSVALSTDGDRVVTAYGNEARVWSAADGHAIGSPLEHHGEVNAVSFSPDGQRIVTASNDKTARVWDAANGREIANLEGHGGPVFSANFSPDGAQIVTASIDGSARLWETASGQEIASMRHDGPVSSSAFSADGKLVLTASDDGTARIWDASTGREIARFVGHDGKVFSAAFNRDATRVVTVSDDDSTTRIWDVTIGRPIAILTGHTDFVSSAAFSPDGTRVVTASPFDQTARVWEAASGRDLATLGGHESVVNSASFNPDGTWIVTASGDKTARVWDAASGYALATLTGHEDSIFSATFSPDGMRVVTASKDKTARIWDAGSGRALVRFIGHDDAVDSAAFSSDGRRVVTASYDKTARIWDATTGRALGTLLGHSDVVHSASFSPDGTRIVTVSKDKTARVWDAESAKPIGEPLKGHTDVVMSAGFSPDGRTIVTASHDKTARIWDAFSGREIAVLKGHEEPVTSAAFSSDGGRIVTASADRTARIWDGASGRQISVLKGHSGALYSAAFSKDGKRVVTASQDKTARVWDVSAIPSGDILAVACALLPDTKLVDLVHVGQLVIDKPVCAAPPPPPDPPPSSAAR